MMQPEASAWQQQLLAWFTPDIAAVAPLTVLIDPDGLYEDVTLVASMEAAGFALLRFDDPLRFRLAYEREYRERWDRGEKTRALVIHSSVPGEELPYDLTEQVTLADHIRSVRLGDFFDLLDPNLVLSLDRDLLGALWQIYQQKRPLHGGINATADYLLAELFQLRPEQWHTTTALLSALLAHHYRARSLPEALVRRITAKLADQFPDWPLPTLWGERSAFYRFLGERWPRYLAQQIASSEQVHETDPFTYLSMDGPADLPFDEKEVRVYLDTLFLEGLIPPVTGLDHPAVPADWMRLGVAPVTEADRVQRFRLFTDQLTEALPAANAPHQDWLEFGHKLGDWLAARWRVSLPADVDALANKFHIEAEQRFTGWVTTRFSALLSLPPVPGPRVVHQVAPHMARSWDAQGRPKRALIVVDGMSWAQWSLLREELTPVKNLQVEDGSILAFVPTITQVSRQAIFAGELPWNFASSIGTTSKEEAHWRSFWERQGAMKAQVGYLLYGEGETNASFFERLGNLIGKPATRIVGLVLGHVDRLTHGIAGVMSSRELQKSVGAWGESGLLRQVVEHLLSAGYEIWLTSDHGNIQAMGVGDPATGSVTEERSERALAFQFENLRDATATKFPNAVKWTGAGLPDNYFALVASGFEAFTSTGKHTLSHGGISIEEMVVPFVRMEQKR